MTVRKGKGGHGGVVECREDPYLYERLPQFLERNREGKVFYSESYMRQKADQLGIECHDLSEYGTRGTQYKHSNTATSITIVIRTYSYSLNSTTECEIKQLNKEIANRFQDTLQHTTKNKMKNGE